jgi:hypothetical protein
MFDAVLDLGCGSLRPRPNPDQSDDLFAALAKVVEFVGQRVQRCDVIFNARLHRVRPRCGPGVGRPFEREFDLGIRGAKHPVPVAAIEGGVGGPHDLHILL